MRVSLIAAISENLVIGDKGKLPWRLPDDMARFKRLTMGHPVVMGRSTYQSMGKPLAGRQNIVLTRNAAFAAPGCQIVSAREEAMAAGTGAEELFVIGGASIFQLFLPIATRMYLTHVEGNFTGDTYFPRVHWEEWRVLAESPGRAEAPGAPEHRFIDYERKSG
ncbi:MAG TPA: dihydrofolate reductase [Spirochaetia bacterium]|nr:dihydrofolate reductase [Spirochaetia bacterium]